jgi:hypothetical protein
MAMKRCSCGYFPGENFSGNCATCIALISVRGAKKRCGSSKACTTAVSVPPKKQKTKALVPAAASAVDVPTMPSRQVGKAALSVFSRAQAASAIAVAHSCKVSQAVDPVPSGIAAVSKGEDFAFSPYVRASGFRAGVFGGAAAVPQPLAANKTWAQFGVGQDVSPDSAAGAAAVPQPLAANMTWAHFGVGQDVSPDSAAGAAAVPQPLAANMTWAHFGVGQDVSPDSAAASAAVLSTQAAEKAGSDAEFSSQSQNGAEEEGDSSLYDTHNASATQEAVLEAGATRSDDVHIDLGEADSSTMPTWWEMFLNSKCGGGFLARSLFSAAAQDSVLGSQKWNGPTSVTQKKQVLADMRTKWIEWNENATVNEWVRAKLFHIIVTNPKTYAKFKVNEV